MEWIRLQTLTQERTNPVKIRHAAQTFVLWSLVSLAVAIVATAHSWWPSVVRHAAGMGADPLPGARRKPTPAELEAARRSWMRRKFGDEQHGPSVKEVLDDFGRRGYPSPPDVLEPLH